MTRSYLRGLAVLLLAYGLAGLAISDISGLLRFGWLEVVATIIAGLAALWLGFRRSLAPDSFRAARIYSLTLIAVAAFGLWGPTIPLATLEPSEMIVWALAGIFGLIAVLTSDRPVEIDKNGGL
ncbi:hypothetical protein A3F28_03850 [Candidatus Uhrbacteria bacterium RIFCSPHIGHO2_12_FULL_57_11]|uniref:Uncharacterized protein n=2 Tax=Candidatus Uhriibacteriota TaxID=1752732 RepID=A0A1F7UK64_9BACT|nr:MAG: hypothetical protein A3D72_00025 [Candidatus Uhrbacteria bacterium RIFCSPHIGHO2_02_FULL_57_19]OGL78662.1 MAG: hypothetical protein A3F28_03850 [Candidatus Uhrbacteria bacterium RIFCSPHIGHO2_12_FULL_57_11]